MTWNYRIIKDTITQNGKTYPRVGVYEVYYNDDGSIMTCNTYLGQKTQKRRRWRVSSGYSTAP